jgi:hypothetical protein
VQRRTRRIFIARWLQFKRQKLIFWLWLVLIIKAKFIFRLWMVQVTELESQLQAFTFLPQCSKQPGVLQFSLC